MITQFLIMTQVRNCHYHRISYCHAIHDFHLDIDILNLLIQLVYGKFTDEWPKQLLNNPGEGIPVQDEVCRYAAKSFYGGDSFTMN